MICGCEFVGRRDIYTDQPPRLEPCQMHEEWMRAQAGLHRLEMHRQRAFHSTNADGAPWIELRNFPIETEMVFDTHSSDGFPRVTVSLHVRNRDKPEAIRITRSESLYPEATPVRVAHAMHHMVRYMVLHELDECFFVNGKHMVEPHPEQKSTASHHDPFEPR